MKMDEIKTASKPIWAPGGQTIPTMRRVSWRCCLMAIMNPAASITQLLRRISEYIFTIEDITQIAEKLKVTFETEFAPESEYLRSRAN